MKAKLEAFHIRKDGRQEFVLSTEEDLTEKIDALLHEDLTVDMEKWRDPRSLDANALFHVLVNRIAEHENVSDKEIKRDLVLDYGALETDSDGCVVTTVLPIDEDVSKYYQYTRCFRESKVGGKACRHYLIFKRTRDMNTKEMSRLISGAMSVAEELGINTDVNIKTKKGGAKKVKHDGN